MSFERARSVARALLYEGYLLYPYRSSSLKNQQRLMFGTLYPRIYAEAERERYRLRAEVIALGDRSTRVRVAAQFLRWIERRVPGEPVRLEASEHWHELEPLSLAALLDSEHRARIELPASHARDGEAELVAGAVLAELEVRAERGEEQAVRLRVDLSNAAAGTEPLDRHAATRHALVSAHLLFAIDNGEFVSLLEPEPEWQALAAACKNDGVFPVLVGAPKRRDLMLASPIVVYDYPALAPESGGDYFDATEIDEILALRVRTLTDAEKVEVARDPHARAVLERSERLDQGAFEALHGAWRDPGLVNPTSDEMPVARASEPGPGERVRLRPKPGRDVFDLVLAGELATVVSLEEDFEGRRYWTVTVDADPGRDLGVSGQPGHRFFFELDELERLS
jgi:hypothetical protein